MNSSTDFQSPGLTIETLKEVMKTMRMMVLYADPDFQEKGQALYVPPTSVIEGITTSPGYFIFHPDDLADIRQQCPLINFVHLRDYKR